MVYFIGLAFVVYFIGLAFVVYFIDLALVALLYRPSLRGFTL